jgi:hypothetical protein
MARPGRPERSRTARSFRQLKRFHHVSNPDEVFGTHREQFAKRGYFEVIGSDSGKRYRIHAGASVNVCEMDERGRPLEGLCFMPIGALPIGDVMLAQKIALETCEGEARAVARRFTPNRFDFGQAWPLG